MDPVFIEIQLGDYSPNSMRFKAELAAMDEVMDFYRLASSAPKLITEHQRKDAFPLPPDPDLAY